MVLSGAFLLSFCLLLHFSASSGEKKDKGTNEADKWKKKDVRDYSDADVERLYEQWEDADDDELEPDELPEWKREPPPVDMSKLDPSKPEDFLKVSKKGRTLMMFATVAGDPTEAETEKISALWHSSLFNANIETQRFVVGSNRVLFMCRDGSQAWDIKDFLVTQDNCHSVEIEGQTYHGKGSKAESSDKQASKEKAEEQASEEKAKKQTSGEKADKQANKEKAKKQASREKVEKQASGEKSKKQANGKKTKKQANGEKTKKQASAEKAEKQASGEKAEKQASGEKGKSEDGDSKNSVKKNKKKKIEL